MGEKLLSSECLPTESRATLRLPVLLPPSKFDMGHSGSVGNAALLSQPQASGISGISGISGEAETVPELLREVAKPRDHVVDLLHFDARFRLCFEVFH